MCVCVCLCECVSAAGNDMGAAWRLRVASEESARKFSIMLVLSTGFLIAEVPPPPGGANLKSISHRCYLFEVAFVWELTKETIVLPLGCLQGGCVMACDGLTQLDPAPWLGTASSAAGILFLPAMPCALHVVACQTARALVACHTVRALTVLCCPLLAGLSSLSSLSSSSSY